MDFRERLLVHRPALTLALTELGKTMNKSSKFELAPGDSTDICEKWYVGVQK